LLLSFWYSDISVEGDSRYLSSSTSGGKDRENVVENALFECRRNELELFGSRLRFSERFLLLCDRIGGYREYRRIPRKLEGDNLDALRYLKWNSEAYSKEGCYKGSVGGENLRTSLLFQSIT